MEPVSNYDLVREFHQAFGLQLDGDFNEKTIDLRCTLHDEEVFEAFCELNNQLISKHGSEWDVKQPDEIDKAALTKELADILYVVYGTAASFGLPINAAFREVHRSNMSKLGEDGKPIYREDGKALKGPNYSPADIGQFFK